jgi:hypothetical protein
MAVIEDVSEPKAMGMDRLYNSGVWNEKAQNHNANSLHELVLCF